MKVLIETENYKAIQYQDTIQVIGKAKGSRKEVILENVINTPMNVGYAIRFVKRFEKYHNI